MGILLKSFRRLSFSLLELKPFRRVGNEFGALIDALTLPREEVIRLRSANVELAASWVEKGIATRVSPDNLEKLKTFSGAKGVQLLEDFEAMLAHPLCKKYLKNKPVLYIASDLPEHITAGGNELIFISDQLLQHSTSAEAKNHIGHELGHILGGDLRRSHDRWKMRLNQKHERWADRISVVLSQEPEAAKSGLAKLKALHYGPLDFNRHYPSLRSRFHSIDAVAGAMADPEKCKHLLADIEHQLSKGSSYVLE